MLLGTLTCWTRFCRSCTRKQKGLCCQITFRDATQLNRFLYCKTSHSFNNDQLLGSPSSFFFISDMKIFLSHLTTAGPNPLPLLTPLKWVSLLPLIRFVFHSCLLILNLFFQRNIHFFYFRIFISPK